MSASVKSAGGNGSINIKNGIKKTHKAGEAVKMNNFVALDIASEMIQPLSSNAPITESTPMFYRPFPGTNKVLGVSQSSSDATTNCYIYTYDNGGVVRITSSLHFKSILGLSSSYADRGVWPYAKDKVVAFYHYDKGGYNYALFAATFVMSADYSNATVNTALEETPITSGVTSSATSYNNILGVISGGTEESFIVSAEVYNIGGDNSGNKTRLALFNPQIPGGTHWSGTIDPQLFACFSRQQSKRPHETSCCRDSEGNWHIVQYTSSCGNTVEGYYYYKITVHSGMAISVNSLTLLSSKTGTDINYKYLSMYLTEKNDLLKFKITMPYGPTNYDAFCKLMDFTIDKSNDSIEIGSIQEIKPAYLINTDDRKEVYNSITKVSYSGHAKIDFRYFQFINDNIVVAFPENVSLINNDQKIPYGKLIWGIIYIDDYNNAKMSLYMTKINNIKYVSYDFYISRGSGYSFAEVDGKYYLFARVTNSGAYMYAFDLSKIQPMIFHASKQLHLDPVGISLTSGSTDQDVDIIEF